MRIFLFLIFGMLIFSGCKEDVSEPVKQEGNFDEQLQREEQLRKEADARMALPPEADARATTAEPTPEPAN